MITFLVAYYAICQIFILAMFFYCYIRDELEFSRENLILVATLFVFGPLGVTAFFFASLYEKFKDDRKLKCQRAMTKWETAARKSTTDVNAWDWYMDPKSNETRHNLLRETISCLTDKELKLLITVDESTYEVEKPLVEAIMDEIIHREMVKA